MGEVRWVRVVVLSGHDLSTDLAPSRTTTCTPHCLACPVVAIRKQHKQQTQRIKIPKLDCQVVMVAQIRKKQRKAKQKRRQKKKPDCQIATLPDCQIAMVAEIRLMHDSDGICAPRAPIRAWFGADHARGVWISPGKIGCSPYSPSLCVLS